MPPGQAPPSLADVLGQVMAAFDPRNAAVNRRMAIQIPRGPVPVPIALGSGTTPYGMEVAMNSAERMPETRPYLPSALARVPDQRPYVPNPLDVLGSMLYGLDFGRG